MEESHALKLTYNGETRRFQFKLEAPVKNARARVAAYCKNDFDTLARVVAKLFPQLEIEEAKLRDTVLFRWIDEDGDLITVTSSAELQEAIRILKETNKTLKFEIGLKTDQKAPPASVSASKDASPNDSVHQGVICDECGMSPIVGTRYKCAVREDYDVCAACEATKPSKYPWLKIADPSQAPAAVFVVLHDDDRPFPFPGPFGPFGNFRGPPGPHGRRGGGRKGPGAEFAGMHGMHGPPPFHPHGPRGGRHMRGPPADPERRFGPWGFGLPPCLKRQIAAFESGDEETFQKEMMDLCGKDIGADIVKAARAFVDGVEAANASNGFVDVPSETPADPELEEAIRQSMETAEKESSKSLSTTGGGACSPTPRAETETSTLTVPSVSAEEEVSVEDVEDDDSDDGIVKVSAPVSPATSQAEPSTPAAGSEQNVSPVPSTTSEPAVPEPLDVWSRVWAKELAVLADMGFHDNAELIPLLEKHVKVPVSLSPELNGVPNSEGMQRVVSMLISS
jgi:hypothetical protein